MPPCVSSLHHSDTLTLEHSFVLLTASSRTPSALVFCQLPCLLVPVTNHLVLSTFPIQIPPEGQSLWSQFSYLGRIFMCLAHWLPASQMAWPRTLGCALCLITCPHEGKRLQNRTGFTLKRSIGGVVSPPLNQGAYHWLWPTLHLWRRAREEAMW